MDFENDGKLTYKSSEVARMLGITVATLKKLVLAGEIKCIVIKTHRYFTKDQIREYIDRHTVDNG